MRQRCTAAMIPQCASARYVPASMDKPAVRAVLEQIAASLALKGDNPFRIRAFENAARAVAGYPGDLDDALQSGARAEAVAVQRALGALPGVQRVEIAGSVRRRREVIRDLDFVVVQAGTGTPETLVEQLGEAPGVDVVVTSPDDFGLAWVRATGAVAHWNELRARGLDTAGRFPDEESVYRALGLGWIPPELREGAGECDAAAAGTLPRLIEPGDVKGFAHCHSNYSDGSVTIAEWAEAAKEAGYAWVGLTDHSQSAPFAMGLRLEAIGRQP